MEADDGLREVMVDLPTQFTRITAAKIVGATPTPSMYFHSA